MHSPAGRSHRKFYLPCQKCVHYDTENIVVSVQDVVGNERHIWHSVLIPCWCYNPMVIGMKIAVDCDFVWSTVMRQAMKNGKVLRMYSNFCKNCALSVARYYGRSMKGRDPCKGTLILALQWIFNLSMARPQHLLFLPPPSWN